MKGKQALAKQKPLLPLLAYPFIVIPSNSFTPTMRQAELKAADERSRSLMPPHFQQCLKLLDRLGEHEFAFFFKYPVDANRQGLIDYWKVVNRPMDMTTIQHKLRNELYGRPAQFDADILLMINNALRYNSEDFDLTQRIHKFARHYQDLYYQLLHLLRTTRFPRPKRATVALPQKRKGKSHLSVQEKLLIFREKFFTEARLRQLGECLSRIPEKGRSQIRQRMIKKFVDFDPISENVSIAKLPIDQLLELIRLARKYKQENYGCSQTALLRMAAKRASKPQQQQESSFEIEDD